MSLKTQLIGFCFFNWLIMIMVAKHPHVHYLIPALGLVILNMVMDINTVKVPHTMVVRQAFPAAALVVVLSLSYVQAGRFIRMAEKKRESAKLQLAAAHFADLLKEKDLYVMSSYRSSNRMYALYFGKGDIYSGQFGQVTS